MHTFGEESFRVGVKYALWKYPLTANASSLTVMLLAVMLLNKERIKSKVVNYYNGRRPLPAGPPHLTMISYAGSLREIRVC